MPPASPTTVASPASQRAGRWPLLAVWGLVLSTGGQAADVRLPPAQVTTRQLAGLASGPVLAIDGQGIAHLAWSQAAGLYPAIVVARWIDGRFELLGPDADAGGASGTRGEATAPALAVANAGLAALVWQDRSSGNNEVYLRRWRDGAWEPQGPLSSGAGVSDTPTRHSARPSLALDPLGNVNVAWEESFGSRSDIFVRRIDRGGVRAVDVGGQAGLTGFPAKSSRAQQVSLAVDASGRPSLAWIDNASGRDAVFVRRWRDGAWQDLRGARSGTGGDLSRGTASSPTLRLDREGNPVVGWREAGTSGDRASLHVARWTGRAWQRLGDDVAAPGEQPSWPSVALDQESRPLVAYRSAGSVRLRRWLDGSWVDVARFDWDSPPATTRAERRLLALDARDGKACLTWIDEGPQPAVHLACEVLTPR